MNAEAMGSSENPYVGAYPVLKGRRRVWREIARYIQCRSPYIETLVEKIREARVARLALEEKHTLDEIDRIMASKGW